MNDNPRSILSTKPIFIFNTFIFSLIALASSLFVYIRWHLKMNEAFDSFILKYNLRTEQVYNPQTWVFVVILSILFAIIVVGMILIFVYGRKLTELYRLQQSFINGLTHELKTPLTSLRLYLDTFTSHDLKRNDQLRYLSYMKKDTERITDNVNRILNLSKLEDKKNITEKIEIVLLPFIDKIAEGMRNSHKDSSIQVVGDETIVAKIGPQLFELAITNLIANGIQHNLSERAEILIDLRKKGKWAQILVSDNGPGIPEKERKKVFKKFYQIGTSSKGSGLGLYIVALIVRLHRGNIYIFTSKSKSVFSLVIPAKK